MISRGEIILVEDKAELMRKLGKKQLILCLHAPLAAIPPGLGDYQLDLSAEGTELVYTFDAQGDGTGIVGLMRQLSASGVHFKDLHTRQDSLEDIFVSLVSAQP